MLQIVEARIVIIIPAAHHVQLAVPIHLVVIARKPQTVEVVHCLAIHHKACVIQLVTQRLLLIWQTVVAAILIQFVIRNSVLLEAFAILHVLYLFLLHFIQLDVTVKMLVHVNQMLAQLQVVLEEVVLQLKD